MAEQKGPATLDQVVKWLQDATTRLVAERDALKARVEELEKALREIADPVEAMLRQCPQGHAFDGDMACRIASNPDYLRGIARKALGVEGGEK